MSKPDFIGVGAQKAATTWIYDILSDHPEVGLSETKELDFFSRWFDQGYQWYENQFGPFEGPRIVGELSPSYLNEPAVPQRVAEYSANMKIIVSLREPVSRAISNHKHEVRVGHFGGDDLSFEAGLKNNPSYVDQGRYATHLNSWLKYFPREQMLILLYEDIVKDPNAVARQVYEFLGISADFVSASLTDRSNVGHLKKNPQLDDLRRKMRLALARIGIGWLWEGAARLGLRKLYRKTAWLEADALIPPVSEEIRASLREQFLPEVEQLEQLLDRQLPAWKKASKSQQEAQLPPTSEVEVSAVSADA